jgi:hypothetical protein
VRASGQLGFAAAGIRSGLGYHEVVKVFISYAQPDRRFAESLGKELNRSGIDVWEPAHVQPGQNWALEAGKALAQADAFVVLLSPDAATSDSVQREIEFALSSPQFKARLIPVLVRPTRDVPWILEELPQWLDARTAVAAAKGVVQALRPASRRRRATKGRKTTARAKASAAR